MPGKTKVGEGEVWEVECTSEGESSSFRLQKVEPWDYPLKILKESKTWVVIEKPEGISVHPSSSERSNKTVVNALVYHFGKNLSVSPRTIEEEFFRPGIIHRLDKVTSGVLLIAKTNATHRFFQKNWNKVEKTYYALVQGKPPKKGKIEAGILRDTKDRKKMAVSNEEKAKEAVTFFETVEGDGKLSLLKIIIPTGRTHQIRVHLSAIGFPILGDEKYGGSKADRVYLHAEKLVFPDPDKENIICKASLSLPKKFII